MLGDSFIQVSKRCTQLLRKARSAQFWNPETWALKGKAHKHGSRPKAPRLAGRRHAYRTMRRGTPRTRGQARAMGASHPARLVASCWRRCSQLVRDATRKWGRGRARGDMRSLAQKTTGARQRRLRARPGLAGACEDRSAERFWHHKKYTRASNSRKTPIGPVLKRRPPPRPESYRAGRGRPHPESFTSRWGRVILFGSHTVCPLQLKSLRAHQTSTSSRTRSYPLGDRRASAKGGASSTSLAPPPTPGGQTAPELRQDPWDPPLELKPLPFRVPATEKCLLKLPESRVTRQEGGTPIPPASHTKPSWNLWNLCPRAFSTEPATFSLGLLAGPAPAEPSPTHVGFRSPQGFIGPSNESTIFLPNVLWA